MRHHPVHRAAAALAAGALALTATLVPATAAPPPEVSTERVHEHLEVLQAVATANQGHRASGSPGGTATKDYLVGVLRAAGYTPQVQTFEFPYFQELAPAVVTAGGTALPATEVATMALSAAGTVTAPVHAVDTTGERAATTSGCEAEDFAGFPAGAVALLQRGTCTFGAKAANAQAAGASAVLIFNTGMPGEEGVVQGTLGDPAAVTVPVVGLSWAAGTALLAGGEVTVTTQTLLEQRRAHNVTAQTAGGDPSNTVVVGAHLDSVPEGPGINDNGTGTAAVLALAEAMAGTPTANAVRFAWWGAEESGLVGSEYYVADLRAADPEGLADIALYLNLDMIGSPNYGRFVHDGDASAFDPGAVVIPEGSAAIEAAFHAHFGSRGLASGETAFDGRSDYGPFVAAGIPSGGLFTGAEGIKTVEQAALFGGRAGIPYDLCYHAACDDLANVDRRGLTEMLDATAAVVARFAASTQEVNGRGAVLEQVTAGPAGTVDTGGGPHPEHREDPAA